jgi:TatD DNase family protein
MLMYQPPHDARAHGCPNAPLVQIAINLSDPVYRGIHHGRLAHEDDLSAVISRAISIGCSKLMITGSSLVSATDAIHLSEQHPSTCFATVGIHPCSTQDFHTHAGGASALLHSLKELISEHAYPKGPVTAIGEIGLDYDRLTLSPKATQLEYFEAQLDLATSLDNPLPLFLHSRAAATDFEALLRPRLNKLPRRGLVHSFTGTVAEMQRLVEMGFDIGINGCSVRTEEGCEVVKEIPLERMQVETDGPWCEIRPSHYSMRYLKGDATKAEQEWKAVKKERFVMGRMVKGRNEPCMITKVVEVIAGVKDTPVEVVAEA